MLSSQACCKAGKIADDGIHKIFDATLACTFRGMIIVISSQFVVPFSSTCPKNRCPSGEHVNLLCTLLLSVD